MMLPGYGDIQEVSTIVACVYSVLCNGIMVGAFAYYHSHPLDPWIESRTQELNKAAHRNYNTYVKIDVKCTECGVQHTRLPLFANHTENAFFFRCENRKCTNVIYVSSLDPNTQIIASTYMK